MAKIAILLDNLFEDSEYKKPMQSFKKAGHEIRHLGLSKGKKVYGKKNNTEVTIGEAVKNGEIDKYDALLIPGGYSPDKLRAYKEPVEFVKKFVESGKLVFIICHAAQLLISAKVLKGRKITGWRSIIVDIVNAEAKFVDKEVVVDDNIVSSRSPGDLPAFTKKCLEKLANS